MLLAIGSFSAQAQSTIPFYDVANNSTGGKAQSTMTDNHINVIKTDVASATLDTVKIYPSHRLINITLTVLDSCTLKLQSVAGCYYNDHLDLLVINPAQTGVVKFLGSWALNGAVTQYALTANKKYLIRFFFDGVKWVQYAAQANY